MERRILHLDLDAFFCAVEEKLDSSLKGKAFAVGGSPTGRGVVTSCSYSARAYGVSSAMPMARALQLCPSLLVVKSTRGEYSANSKEVMDVLKNHSEIIQQISIDEAFIEVTHSETDFHESAKNLQTKIFKKTGLPCSIGGASNKLVAKIANNIGKKSIKTKNYPMSINIIPLGDEESFLTPLPVIELWGIGPKTALSMERLGLYTIGDIAEYPLQGLINHFGTHGYSLAQRAKGIDKSSLNSHRTRKSVSHENTFYEDTTDQSKLLDKLRDQASKVSKVLKNKNLKGYTIKIRMRYSNFETLTRQITVPDPVQESKDIFNFGSKLFLENWNKKIALRLIGIGVTNFSGNNSQISLWDAEKNIKQAELSHLVKKINTKYGDKSISIGSENEQ